MDDSTSILNLRREKKEEQNRGGVRGALIRPDRIEGLVPRARPRPKQSAKMRGSDDALDAPHRQVRCRAVQA